ncbi:polysaccharide biosynthesis C-terminal domain-containing protein [Winogradskyella sp.]|uniref:MATE family efflux transporter n=1 Tax=Winogradskyella sp. TaxID=1883156 RepID=UPI00261E9E47|nr:polysaccharide biosynthesis C-terminal domain-containing protein [Winogradskyella sp.]
MLKGLVNQKGKLLGSSLKVLSLRVCGVLIFFGLSLFLTNNFDAELIGRYDFVRSFLLIIGGISLLGTNQSIIYYSGFLKAKNSIFELRRVYFKMISIIFTISLLFFIITRLLSEDFINSFFEKPDAYQLINKVILVLFVYTWSMLNIDMVRALGKTVLSEVFRNVFRYLPFFLIIIFLAFNNLEAYLIESYLISFAILWLCTTVYIGIKLLSLTACTISHRVSYKNILLKSYPMAISAISYFMMQSIDIILLSKYDSYENVAYYAVAVKLATASTLALLSVNVVIAPKIAEIYTDQNKKKLKSLIKNSIRLIFVLTLVATGSLVLLSDFVLKLFGPMYIQAKEALFLLLIGQLVGSIFGSSGIYMNMTGKQNILHKILLTGLAINITLNIIFIPKYGMNGAALATAISMIIWRITASLYAYKKDRIKTFLS